MSNYMLISALGGYLKGKREREAEVEEKQRWEQENRRAEQQLLMQQEQLKELMKQDAWQRGFEEKKLEIERLAAENKMILDAKGVEVNLLSAQAQIEVLKANTGMSEREAQYAISKANIDAENLAESDRVANSGEEWHEKQKRLYALRDEINKNEMQLAIDNGNIPMQEMIRTRQMLEQFALTTIGQGLQYSSQDWQFLLNEAINISQVMYGAQVPYSEIAGKFKEWKDMALGLYNSGDTAPILKQALGLGLSAVDTFNKLMPLTMGSLEAQAPASAIEQLPELQVGQPYGQSRETMQKYYGQMTPKGQEVYQHAFAKDGQTREEVLPMAQKFLMSEIEKQRQNQPKPEQTQWQKYQQYMKDVVARDPRRLEVTSLEEFFKAHPEREIFQPKMLPPLPSLEASMAEVPPSLSDISRKIAELQSGLGYYTKGRPKSGGVQR